jgi:hypothetical protein
VSASLVTLTLSLSLGPISSLAIVLTAERKTHGVTRLRSVTAVHISQYVSLYRWRQDNIMHSIVTVPQICLIQVSEVLSKTAEGGWFALIGGRGGGRERVVRTLTQQRTAFKRLSGFQLIIYNIWSSGPIYTLYISRLTRSQRVK